MSIEKIMDTALISVLASKSLNEIISIPEVKDALLKKYEYDIDKVTGCSIISEREVFADIKRELSFLNGDDFVKVYKSVINADIEHVGGNIWSLNGQHKTFGFLYDNIKTVIDHEYDGDKVSDFYNSIVRTIQIDYISGSLWKKYTVDKNMS